MASIWQYASPSAAKELGITIIAYSPLGQGVLTGRFHDAPDSVKQAGVRRWTAKFRRGGLEKSRPVVEALREIATAQEATPGPIALAWLVQFHGDMVVAIPGATKPTQVADLAASMRVKLTPDELARLDAVSRAFL